MVFSFIIAAIGCAFAGMCYSEFATMIPIAGSAYTYAYATMGELLAWIIGWDLVLEYAVGAATVSVSWSNYLVRLLGHFGISLARAPHRIAACEGGIVNLPAIFIICVISIILIIGISESARVNGRHRGAESHHRDARDRARLGLYQSRQLRAVHSAQHRRIRPLRLERRHARRRRDLLRLHRIRRRFHRRAGSQEAAARHAHRHHRIAGHLHDALRALRVRADRHRQLQGHDADRHLRRHQQDRIRTGSAPA